MITLKIIINQSYLSSEWSKFCTYTFSNDSEDEDEDCHLKFKLR